MVARVSRKVSGRRRGSARLCEGSWIAQVKERGGHSRCGMYSSEKQPAPIGDIYL